MRSRGILLAAAAIFFALATARLSAQAVPPGTGARWVDTDGDGIPDEWERHKYPTSPTARETADFAAMQAGVEYRLSSAVPVGEYTWEFRRPVAIRKEAP